jgi:hypothetical protein
MTTFNEIIGQKLHGIYQDIFNECSEKTDDGATCYRCSNIIEKVAELSNKYETELDSLKETYRTYTEMTASAYSELATANAKLARVRELCYLDGYTTWDDSMVFALNGFGAHNSEELKKWEAMHGHDIRLKCYAEFGCQLLVDPEDIIRALDEEDKNVI